MFHRPHPEGERQIVEYHTPAGPLTTVTVYDEAICPSPMTKLTLAETRRAFDGRITIMGGFPSVALVKDAMTDRQFDAYLDDFFLQVGCGDHLILGISDTTPPAAEFDRLLKIRDRIEAFGPVAC